jgi:hypothetical protein
LVSSRFGGHQWTKACKVVNSVVTADCVTMNPSTFWVDGYNQHLSNGSVTWEFSLLDTSKTSESYAQFKFNPTTYTTSHQGTVTSTNPVQVTSSGINTLLMLFRAIPT